MKKNPTLKGLGRFKTPSLRKPRQSIPALSVTVVRTKEDKVTITAVLRPSSAGHALPSGKTILAKIEKAVRSAVLGQLKSARAPKPVRSVPGFLSDRSDAPMKRAVAKRAARKPSAVSVSPTRPPPPPKG